MAYTATSFTFGEQPSAAKWNQLGSNDAYFDSLVGSGTAWTSWTPTFANLTAGNGTHASKYQVLGKTVRFRFSFILGSTSSMGTSPTFTLPVTSVSPSPANLYLGNVRLVSAGSANPGAFLHSSTTVVAFITYDANSTFVRETGLTSTVPGTWTTGDSLSGYGIYEAA